MPRSFTNDQLARILESPQVDRTILDEAARRIRSMDLSVLLTLTEAVSAISANPLLDQHARDLATISVLGIAPHEHSTSRLTALAQRILAGEKYSYADVLSLAIIVARCDDA